MSDSPFSFAAPTPAPFPSPYSSLALLASDASSAVLLGDLARSLLALRTTTAYKREIGILSGELRDEWRGRIAGVKADFMARIVADPTEGMDEDDHEDTGEDESEQEPTTGSELPSRAAEGTSVEALPTPLMVPTIISDHDGLQNMSNRVDSIVEADFKQYMDEAEGRLRSAVLRREKVELEVLLGGLVLQALEVTDSDEAHAREIVVDNLQDALAELGWDGVPLALGPTWEKLDTM